MEEPGDEIDRLAFAKVDLGSLLTFADEAAAEGDAELAANIIAQIYRALDRYQES